VILIGLQLAKQARVGQGKSRDENLVELGNCKSHPSYYMVLSRGTSAAGTAIMQGFFDASKITSGMSGYLWQELRELEILDDITQLRFDACYPNTLRACTETLCSDLIKHGKVLITSWTWCYQMAP
jgi:hypothetical protein